jgi:hypothetical protein
MIAVPWESVVDVSRTGSAGMREIVNKIAGGVAEPG